MSKGLEGPSTFYMGSRGKSRHLDASAEGRTQDFMSRNSLGSPTFMFYPVIMMSTYTLDKTKHYPSYFSPSLFLSALSPFPSSPSSPRCRNRNSSATRKCHAFLRGEKCSSSDFHSFAFISSGRLENVYRLPS